MKKKKAKKIKTTKNISKKQIAEQNKTLKYILFGIIIIIVGVFAGFFISNSMKHFEYNGLKFNIIQEGKITFYQTSIPVIYNGQNVNYNFYLRNDPRKSKVDFNGNLSLSKFMVVNSTADIYCEGYGTIAIANLLKLYEVLGVNVIRDENATCDEGGQFMHIQIQESDKTSIEQTGPKCYNLNLNNCEILQVTEKFMIETLTEISK